METKEMLLETEQSHLTLCYRCYFCHETKYPSDFCFFFLFNENLLCSTSIYYNLHTLSTNRFGTECFLLKDRLRKGERSWFLIRILYIEFSFFMEISLHKNILFKWKSRKQSFLIQIPRIFFFVRNLIFQFFMHS